jgi:hypothetical protein
MSFGGTTRKSSTVRLAREDFDAELSIVPIAALFKDRRHGDDLLEIDADYVITVAYANYFSMETIYVSDRPSDSAPCRNMVWHYVFLPLD